MHDETRVNVVAKKKEAENVIARNRRARFDYHIERRFEAGLVLQGWEVKSIRAGKVQISEAYVTVQNGEAFLRGSVVKPLHTASSHVVPVDNRPRKLLLHANEITQLFQAVQQKGKTSVPTRLYWSGPFVKCEIAIGTGKKEYDKRRTIKERDLEREKQRNLSRY